MYRSRSSVISWSYKNLWTGSSRTARSHQTRTIDPELTRQALLHNYKAAHGDYSIAGSSRHGKSAFIHTVFPWNVRHSLSKSREREREKDPYPKIALDPLQRESLFFMFLSKDVGAANYIVTQWKLFIISLISY